MDEKSVVGIVTTTLASDTSSLSRPERSLPKVVPSCGEVARTRADALHGHEVPIAGIAGDQQAALFGQRCLEPGLGKNTYGTGSFVLLNAGTAKPEPGDGLLATIAWQIGQSRTYALEAFGANAGNALGVIVKVNSSLTGGAFGSTSRRKLRATIDTAILISALAR